MEKKLTEEDAREGLRNHIQIKAKEARQKYGESIGFSEVCQMLADPEVVRFPTVIAYGAEKLEPGEFAWPEPRSESAHDGYVLHVHPSFEGDTEALPILVSYHFASINYGEIAGSEDAELFGASLLGMDVEDYYQALCRYADTLGAS